MGGSSAKRRGGLYLLGLSWPLLAYVPCSAFSAVVFGLPFIYYLLGACRPRGARLGCKLLPPSEKPLPAGTRFLDSVFPFLSRTRSQIMFANPRRRVLR